MSRHFACHAPGDLDLREREVFTMAQKDRPLVILVPEIPHRLEGWPVDSQTDLFRRITEWLGVEWATQKTSFPAVESLVAEFQQYVNQFGSGYVAFRWDRERKGVVQRLCSGSKMTFGIELYRKVFLLPCATPQSAAQAAQMAKAAVEAVIAYRKRTSREMPEWAANFVFSEESTLREKVGELRGQVAELEGTIDTYISFKGALCYQSDPLVGVVREILDHFFNIQLTVDDKCIEDATLQDDDGTIQAVVEVKGVKNNFIRKNVNQVDSHRERLELPATIPGVLVMNTFRGVDSLQEKDQAPHPDIVKKAVTDRVLLIRTLDLLRYADAVEGGTLTKEEFRTTFLNESGWLKVEDGKAEVVKE